MGILIQTLKFGKFLRLISSESRKLKNIYSSNQTEANVAEKSIACAEHYSSKKKQLQRNRVNLQISQKPLV